PRFAQRGIADDGGDAGMRKPQQRHAAVGFERTQIAPSLGVRAIVGNDELPIPKGLAVNGGHRRTQVLQAPERRQNDRYHWLHLSAHPPKPAKAILSTRQWVSEIHRKVSIT